jgi:hypothetical protein
LRVNEIPDFQTSGFGLNSITHISIPGALPRLLQTEIRGLSAGFEDSTGRQDSPRGSASPQKKRRKLNYGACVGVFCAGRFAPDRSSLQSAIQSQRGGKLRRLRECLPVEDIPDTRRRAPAFHLSFAE